MTIRARLTFWYSSLLAIIIVIFGVALLSVLNWTWQVQIQQNMEAVAKKVIPKILLDQYGDIIGVQWPKNMVDSFGEGPFFIQLRNSEGESVVSLNWPDGLTVNSAAGYTVQGDYGHVFNDPSRYFVYTVNLSTSAPGSPPSVQIATRLDAIDQATERLIRIMIGVGGIAILISILVGSVIAGQALQPIDIIAQAAAKITAADDLSRRIPYDGPNDELGMLTNTFNATLTRLERLFNSQRRFVADVSHELRTPLTTLQGNLDLIKRMGPEPELIDAMSSEIGRMSRLVSDLLLLARANSGHLPLQKQILDLDTLVTEVYRQGKILGTQVQFKMGHIEPIKISGDPDRLKQLLLNLVTNAIKYTPAGGTVTLSMGAENGYALVHVADTGIGIPQSDLDLIFERFYRVDKARSRQMGGACLGLSIAQWIARSHGGKIAIESEEGKGSTFTLFLPMLNSDGPSDGLTSARPRLAVSTLGRRRPSLPVPDKEELDLDE